MNTNNQIILQVDGNEYPLQSLEYRIHRDIDIIGMPSSNPRGGIFECVRNSDHDLQFLILSMDYHRSFDGQINFFNEVGERYKKIKFDQAYLIDYRESIKVDSPEQEGSKLEFFIFSAKSININGHTLMNAWPE